MRMMLAALIVLAGAWSVYWWIGSGREEARVAAWLEDTRAVTADAQKMRGYPNRYDTTLEAARVDAGSLTWDLPWVQLFRLSYRPGHYVVSFAPEQTVTFESQDFTLAMQDGRASVVFEETGMDHSNAVFDAVAVSTAADWQLEAPTILFATRLAEGGHEIGINIAALTTGEASTDLRLDGVLTFPGGVPEGTLTLTAPDPAALATIAADIGLPAFAHGAELRFVDGQVKLGDEYLGAAPKLPIE